MTTLEKVVRKIPLITLAAGFSAGFYSGYTQERLHSSKIISECIGEGLAFGIPIGLAYSVSRLSGGELTELIGIIGTAPAICFGMAAGAYARSMT
jgi:hypothetical protein